MEISDGMCPTKKLYVFAAIGVCSGIAVFFISDAMSKGSHTLWCLTLAFLASILTFAASSGTLFYILYKRTIRIIIKLKEKSSIDQLTELYNRSFIEPFIESEIHTAKKDKQDVSVIMVDLDHFKEINDTYGHAVGDHVLAIFAQVVLKCIRKTDIIARYGGDEFIVVLPNTDTDTAKSVAERIREDVSKTHIPPLDGVVISSINCSVGISTYPEHCDSKNSLIRTSDLALYMAKRSGRNCIKVYQRDLVLN